MPARDYYHDQVKRALVKDGWTITHDPLKLKAGKKDLYVDLGAQQVIGAEKGELKIAVEIKSFLGKSEVEDLEKALGQFVLYENLMEEQTPDRVLYLAAPQNAWQEIFEEPIGQVLLKNKALRLVVFDPKEERLLRWLPKVKGKTKGRKKR